MTNKDKEFLTKLLQRACDDDGRDVTVLSQSSPNNDGRPCIIIKPNKSEDDISLSSCLYFDEYSEEPLPLIAARIYKDYLKSLKKTDLNAAVEKFARSLSEFKPERIKAKLLNAENNQNRMQTSVYAKFLDLIVVYYVDGGYFKDNHITVDITPSLMEQWGVNIHELNDIALKNSFSETNVISIKEILSDRFNIPIEMLDSLPDDIHKMYAISNTSFDEGAINMLNFKLLDKIAKELDDDLIIIPSSIHEVLVSAASSAGLQSASELNGFIQAVNNAEVEKDKMLSNHGYYYNRESQLIVALE